MLTCIILNYNDADSVLKLYNRIKDYKVLDHIIIVDNASTDDSYQRLKNFSNHKTTILLSDRNGGYGYGNNIGLRYSQKLGATYSLIANPDVSFSEYSIKHCLEFFQRDYKVIAVSPKESNNPYPAYKIVSPFKDLLSVSLVSNKIFKTRYYKINYFKNVKFKYVDVLIGSLVLFDLSKFAECGFYDENVFLYNEEIIIASKFKQKGYLSILDLNSNYNHYHSVSVQKEFKSSIKLKKIGLQSHYYYLKKYTRATWFILMLFKLIVPFVYLEYAIWVQIKSCLRKNKNAEE